MTEKLNLSKEIMRKLIHLALLTLPFLYYNLGKWDFLIIITPIATIVIALDYFRHKNTVVKAIFEKIFGVILRQKEREIGQFNGSSYAFGTAVLLALTCREEIFVTAFVILAICDSIASLVGTLIPSKPFFEKTIAGSAAFYLSGLLIIFFLGALFKTELWFYVFAVFSLFCTTIIEARPSLSRLDDNFSIPVSFAILISSF